MAGAGLTHGGFYSYFKSKSDLYAEVLTCFFTDPNWKSCWEGVKVDLSSGHAGPQVVRAYLSRQHFENVEDYCPMVALPTDVARSAKSDRGAFETMFRAMVSVLERSLTQNGRPRRATAQGINSCASAAWSSPAPWSTALLPMNCATPAWASPSISPAGRRPPNQKTENPKRPQHPRSNETIDRNIPATPARRKMPAVVRAILSWPTPGPPLHPKKPLLHP
jgi:hypothetical protein